MSTNMTYYLSLYIFIIVMYMIKMDIFVIYDNLTNLLNHII